jgi:hypothetical protein
MKSTTTILGFMMIAATGCVATPDEESDGRDDSFATNGKTDTGNIPEGSRKARGVLRVANELSLEALHERAPDGVGLANRVINNLADFRLGDDGLAGTPDDGHFDTLAELDAIPFIGPIAFQKLLTYAEANGYVPPGTIVHGTTDVPASLVAYKDGIDADWQPATVTSPTSFDIEVENAFIVAVACEDLPTGSFTTIRLAQVVSDGDVFAFCGAAIPNTRAVTGHMVQPGRVTIASDLRSSSAPEWDFSLSAVDDTYDLVATTTDAIAFRRGIVVAGDTAVAGPIDVAAEGTPFVGVAFSVANAAPSEAVSARVTVRPQTNLVSATVYSGALATAKAAPASALIATDRQRASVTATEGTLSRSRTRAFAIGGDTAFTLPAPLAAPQWTVDDGELEVRLSSVPAFDFMFIDAFGSSADFSQFWYHDLEVTPAFAAEAGNLRIITTSFALETDIPGYKPEWKLDLAAQYTRRVFAQTFTATDSASSSSSEDVNVGTQRVGRPARMPVAAARHLER